MQVIFDHSRDEAANITTFFFRPEKSVHFTAGQFAEWIVPHENADKRGSKRWFTISSSPSDELVSFTTKFASRDGSSFKRALHELKAGDVIHMSEPMGDFVLPKFTQTPLIFVAGGIGITPFHSIFEWLAATGEERSIKLLYAVTTEDEIVFQDTFDRANIHATIVVDKPSAAWGGERGRLNAQLIFGLEQPTEETLVYVSGPEPMVEALEHDLKSIGLKKNQFVGDFFPNYSKDY